MFEWKNSDPRVELVDRKRASIVILRPVGSGWCAGVGQTEMKHSWHIHTSFEGLYSSIDGSWDDTWLWCLAPSV